MHAPPVQQFRRTLNGDDTRCLCPASRVARGGEGGVECMMSRVIRRSAFALAFVCAAGVAEARAQRVGPTEDDPPAATDGAKTSGERKDAKPDAKTVAKSATKVEP